MAKELFDKCEWCGASKTPKDPCVCNDYLRNKIDELQAQVEKYQELFDRIPFNSLTHYMRKLYEFHDDIQDIAKEIQ